MSLVILVIVPAADRGQVALPGDVLVRCELAPYVSPVGAVTALRRPADGYVLVHDGGLDGDAEVVGAIRAAGAQVVEVRFTRWDGEEHSEVSAACRGVIAGFGMEGVAAAVGLLVQEIAAAAG